MHQRPDMKPSDIMHEEEVEKILRFDDEVNKIQIIKTNSSVIRRNQREIKYPKAVFFIITNEFCERFCYYGMKTVLFLYMLKKLKYEKKEATILYHSWAGLCYFFPIFGGIIADTFLGKFKTIVYLSVIYFLGNVLLSVVSITELALPQRELSLLGLLLIAVGTGGIKPCVSSFGGDQFILPQQQDHLDKFFSFFYFAINAGSFISTFITPIFREDLQCFGENTCFPAAFGVPAALMLTSIVIFIVGRPLYKINKPKGNICVSVCQCIWRALRNKYRTIKSNRTRSHWLDYADDRYSENIINDIKILLRVLVLFVPLPLFWALFDQQGSKWTAQADQMRGEITGTTFHIKPDQMQVINPLLILSMIPLFSYCVYPLIARVGISTPLRKLTTGGLLAGLAFIISALVEFQIRDTRKVETLRVYNQLQCPLTFNSPALSGTLDSMGVVTFSPADKTEETLIKFTPTASCKDVKPFSGQVLREKGKGTAYVLGANGTGELTRLGVYDDIITSSTVPTKVRILYNSELKGKTVVIHSWLGFSKTVTLPADKLYTDYITGLPTGVLTFKTGESILAADVPMKTGGVYIINAHCTANRCDSTLLEAAPPLIHMLWLLPQYIVITAGEIMFSITGFEFAFTQAPISMKSVLSACWLLTVAFGNLIVVIVAEATIFENQAFEFLLFASLMILDMFVFMLLAQRYKYVTHHKSQEEIEAEELARRGTSNAPPRA